jgi:hypothetical protein
MNCRLCDEAYWPAELDSDGYCSQCADIVDCVTPPALRPKEKEDS